MKKGTRIFKQYLATFLIVLMSIESFAAVVGDNDGAAFITKAEFDSMKNDFQSQLDRYNSSIDNKIDGAIASYLSGVAIAKTERKSVLGYDASGIHGILLNDVELTWHEGIIDMKITTYQQFSRNDKGVAAGLLTLKSKEKTPFYEASITSVDRTNNRAIWNGMNYCDYTVAVTGADSNFNWWNDDLGLNHYIALYRGFVTINNIDLSSYSGRQFVCFSTARRADTGTGQSANFIGGYSRDSSITRNIIRSSMSNLMLAPPSCQYKRFVDYDTLRDWQNDDDQTGHTPIDVPSDYWADASYVVNQLEKGSADLKYYRKENLPHTDISELDSPYRATDWNESGMNYYYPFVGFVSAIDDWNQVATNKYDTLVANIKSYKPNVSLYKDASGKEHLMLSAGVPIVELKKDNVMRIECTFNDKSQDYDVWFKTNGWNNGDQLEADGTVISRERISLDRAGNQHCLPGTTGAKSVKIENGHGIIYVEADADGFLFMKWSLSGNSGAGGGTFLPPQTVEVTSF